ncbi:polysaccharide deacetylase family protein [Dactylosporangium sp. NPDC051484]|uniref:polysaccharide deacetylase family protein n=1 Tax=Dactylosporangium sp. NPDC051484 TaxID=3154942 RepID=UPI00344B3EE4
MLVSARNRRIVAMIGACVALAVAVAACDDKVSSRSQSNGAAPAVSAHGTATPSTGGDDPRDPGGSGDPGGSRSPQPSRSGSPAGKPTPSEPGTSTPPTGNAYADRLPKFGQPPVPQRIDLPEEASAAYYARIPTDQPVAFLTIDDGWVKRPEALELLRESGVKVTLFLTINAIKDNPGYFQQLRDAGADIQAHTVTHPELKGKSYAFQKREICGSADQLATLYGKRPTLFRPPFGDKDATTLKVAHDCGLRAGFFWKETVDKGTVRYQEGHTIQKGDIILMHFRTRFVDDFIAALQAISAAGLTPALLTDYMPAA